MRRFSVQREFFERLPGLTIGVVVATGVENSQPSREIERHLERTVEELRINFRFERAQEHPRIKPWRDAFSKLGISGSKFPSSVESMVRRILKGDPFPRINPLVDLYNSLSLKYLVPMGGHDLDTIRGNLYLQLAEGVEPFTPMGGGERVVVPRGEPIYRDDEEVLTRNWVWRQCEKDKVTEKTRNVFIPIDVLQEVGRGKAEEIIGELQATIPSYLGGKVISFVVDQALPSIEFGL